MTTEIQLITCLQIKDKYNPCENLYPLSNKFKDSILLAAYSPAPIDLFSSIYFFLSAALAASFSLTLGISMHFFCLGVFPHLFHQSTPWNEVNIALAFSLEQALNQHGLVRRVDMKHTLLCSCEVREGMIKKKKNEHPVKVGID